MKVTDINDVPSVARLRKRLARAELDCSSSTPGSAKVPDEIVSKLSTEDFVDLMVMKP